MKRIDEILRGALSKKNLNNLLIFTYSWPDIVGEDIAKKTRPSKIINGILFIDAINPAWATQLTFLADQIKNQVNEHLSKKIVREVRFNGSGFKR